MDGHKERVQLKADELADIQYGRRFSLLTDEVQRRLLREAEEILAGGDTEVE